MANSRRVRVEGVRRSEVDTELLSLAVWLQAKRILREKRERDQKFKAKRQRQRERHSEC